MSFKKDEFMRAVNATFEKVVDQGSAQGEHPVCVIAVTVLMQDEVADGTDPLEGTVMQVSTVAPSPIDEDTLISTLEIAAAYQKQKLRDGETLKMVADVIENEEITFVDEDSEDEPTVH